MNTPFQFGWQQIVLILIGLAGLWLFITAAIGLLSPRSFMSEDDKDHYARTGGLPRRRFRMRRGLSGILLLAVAISLLWLTFLVQSYLGLTGEIKVAHIHATSIANVAHEMSVEVILYNGSGNVASDNTYLMQGDEWMLQGDIVKFPACFFKTAYAQRSWFAPFVDAQYGNAVFQTKGSFDVFATQDALIARPTQ